MPSQTKYLFALLGIFCLTMAAHASSIYVTTRNLKVIDNPQHDGNIVASLKKGEFVYVANSQTMTEGDKKIIWRDIYFSINEAQTDGWVPDSDLRQFRWKHSSGRPKYKAIEASFGQIQLLPDDGYGDSQESWVWGEEVEVLKEKSGLMRIKTRDGKEACAYARGMLPSTEASPAVLLQYSTSSASSSRWAEYAQPGVLVVAGFEKKGVCRARLRNEEWADIDCATLSREQVDLDAAKILETVRSAYQGAFYGLTVQKVEEAMKTFSFSHLVPLLMKMKESAEEKMKTEPARPDGVDFDQNCAGGFEPLDEIRWTKDCDF